MQSPAAYTQDRRAHGERDTAHPPSRNADTKTQLSTAPQKRPRSQITEDHFEGMERSNSKLTTANADALYEVGRKHQFFWESKSFAEKLTLQLTASIQNPPNTWAGLHPDRQGALPQNTRCGYRSVHVPSF